MPRGKAEPAQVRFWRFVDRRGDQDCWNWTGHVRRNGYGRFMVAARQPAYAHRFAYEDRLGAIPEGKDLDHLCRNRRCVNPSHLEPVTRAENLRRSSATITSRNAAKTACPRGHPYDALTKAGWRTCYRCKNERRNAKRRAA